MRTVKDLEVSYAHFEQPKVKTRPGLFDRLERKKLLVIIFTVAIAFVARAYQLGSQSMAEDEANKIFAIRAYEQGDFTVNAEHPMVMKMLCYVSVHAVTTYNNAIGSKVGLAVSEEAALRLPNALFGALTVIPLLLLTAALLGFRVSLITSLLWATGIDAIWFSRIVKEDSLLVFFMFSGFYLYNRAKSLPATDIRGQERLYALAGAAFGLMMASKYFPHYFALNALYYTIVGYDSRNNRPLTRRMWGRYFGGLVTAFVVFNSATFLPQTLRYLSKWVNEDLLTHHGYVVMGQMFMNDMSQSPGGNPWYFYYLFMLVKLPLPILVAFLVGLVEIFRRRGSYPKSRGYIFLRLMLVFWLLPTALMGAKFLRYTLSLMPLLYMTAAIGMIVMWRALRSAIRQRTLLKKQPARLLAAAAVAAVFLIAPALTMIRALPHPSLYVNALGRGRLGYYFPHDEFYDLGARESIKYIADTAPPGARMASEIPGVVEYYLQIYNRPDIQSEIMSQPSFTLSEGRPDFVLLQPGRLYFENVENYKFIENHFPVVQSSTYDGATASRVYSVGDRMPLLEGP
ncbi:MAG TPA: glycosyltransferase family 39 protein [Blastocatellia bacterium]|nr:glycosyltransferase family 39 protein [Blastocatellia bacterium]